MAYNVFVLREEQAQSFYVQTRVSGLMNLPFGLSKLQIYHPEAPLWTPSKIPQNWLNPNLDHCDLYRI